MHCVCAWCQWRPGEGGWQVHTPDKWRVSPWDNAGHSERLLSKVCIGPGSGEHKGQRSLKDRWGHVLSQPKYWKRVSWAWGYRTIIVSQTRVTSCWGHQAMIWVTANTQLNYPDRPLTSYLPHRWSLSCVGAARRDCSLPSMEAPWGWE